MSSATVNYNAATGVYSLIAVGSANPGWIWAKWYEAAVEPADEPNPLVVGSSGTAIWTPHPIANSGNLILGPDNVTPAAGNGVKLVVWELEADGTTFTRTSAWEPPHDPPCSSSSSDSSDSSDSSSSDSSETTSSAAYKTSKTSKKKK